MVQHIVLLKLKPGTTDRDVTQAFLAAEALVEDTPGMLEFAFGRDRSDPDHGYGLASIIQFRDQDALNAYLESPERKAYVDEHVAPITDDRIELDVGTDGAHRPTPSTTTRGSGSGA